MTKEQLLEGIYVTQNIIARYCSDHTYSSDNVIGLLSSIAGNITKLEEIK